MIKKFNVFKKLRKNLLINYIEVLNRIMVCIILYKPLLGDIILVNKKRMLSLHLLKSKDLFYTK